MTAPLSHEQERIAREYTDTVSGRAGYFIELLAAALATIDALRTELTGERDRFSALYRALPFDKQMRFGGDPEEAREGVDCQAADARRWRAVRDGLFVERWYDERGWILGTKGTVQKNPAPATLDAAADRLAAEQEARNG